MDIQARIVAQKMSELGASSGSWTIALAPTASSP
jgi:hypothetical protein